jgi:hypothetical protein
MIRKKTALEPCSRCPELVLENRAREFHPMSAAASFPFSLDDSDLIRKMNADRNR